MVRFPLATFLAFTSTIAAVNAQAEIVGRGMQVFDSRWSREAFDEVVGGNYHTVARRSDGTVVAWGLNDDGQTDVIFRRNDGALRIWHLVGTNFLAGAAIPQVPATGWVLKAAK